VDIGTLGDPIISIKKLGKHDDATREDVVGPRAVQANRKTNKGL